MSGQNKRGINIPGGSFSFNQVPSQPILDFTNVQSHSSTTTPHPNVRNTTKDQCLTLPADVLESCKCNYCSCYVTVGPVRMVDGRIACGRCRRETDGVRLSVVEVLAKQFEFPCRYKAMGCNAVLKWVLIDAHEKVCNYKEIKCTVIDCDWIGAKLNLQLHFEQKHGCEIINSNKGITINLQEKKTSNFLYISKKIFFLVFFSNDGEKVYHQIKYFCTTLEACKYIYDVCVYDSEKKMMFLNQKLQSFDEDNDILNAGLSIDVLQSVFTSSNNVNISFQIKYNTNEATSFSAQNVECPVCFEPMLGNIIIGECGHSVCEQCKKSLKNCPCCRSTFFNLTFQLGGPTPTQDIRNYYLENLIKKLNFDL